MLDARSHPRWAAALSRTRAPFLGSLRFLRPLLEVARTVLPFAALMLAWVLLVTYVPALTLGFGALLAR